MRDRIDAVTMQATVHSYDESTGAGEVILDDGRVLSFGPNALAGSGLRLLRVGQRLTIATDEVGAEEEHPQVHRVWLVGIGD